MTESPQQPPDDLPDYGLMTDEGNVRVELAVRELTTAIEAGELERREAVVALADAVQEIAAKHPEVTDITVRDAIIRELRPAFDAAGWPVPEPYEF